MPKNKLSDIERLRKKESELERTRKEIELRENIRKAKDFQKKNVDALKSLKSNKGGKKS